MNQEYSLSPDRALHIPDESSPALSDLSRKLSMYEDLFAPVRDFLRHFQERRVHADMDSHL